MPPLSSSSESLSLKSMRAAARGWRLRNPGGLRLAAPEGTADADVLLPLVLTPPLVGLELSIVYICMVCVVCRICGGRGYVVAVPPLL